MSKCNVIKSGEVYNHGMKQRLKNSNTEFIFLKKCKSDNSARFISALNSKTDKYVHHLNFQIGDHVNISKYQKCLFQSICWLLVCRSIYSKRLKVKSK